MSFLLLRQLTATKTIATDDCVLFGETLDLRAQPETRLFSAVLDFDVAHLVKVREANIKGDVYTTLTSETSYGSS